MSGALSCGNDLAFQVVHINVFLLLVDNSENSFGVSSFRAVNEFGIVIGDSLEKDLSYPVALRI